MSSGNFWLWLAWACFATFLVWLLWKRFLPGVLQAPALPKEAPKPPRAWLFCEEGSALDRKVQWFDLRPGGQSIIGARPRSPTPEAHYLYLTADDIREDHASIAYTPASGRYQVRSLGGSVLHNNEPLPEGSTAELADGDTLDLGRISRFRFTLTGPETT